MAAQGDQGDLTMSEKTGTEGTMATSQELAVREKRELTAKEEKTVPGRLMSPTRMCMRQRTR